jgi:hypothetical protein
LLTWADEVLAPIAKLAYDGLGDFAAVTTASSAR